MAESFCSRYDLVAVVVCLVAFGLLSTAIMGTAAGFGQDLDFEPEAESGLQCVGSGGGVPYTTDSGLTVYENHTADIDRFYFPSTDTVRFNYSTGGVNLSSSAFEADARLESVDNGTVCLADVNINDGGFVVRPDGSAGIGLSGFSIDLAFRDPVFESSDEGVDLVYVGSPYSLTLFETGLDEGQTVRAYDSEGTELENTTVTGGIVGFTELPAEGTHEIDFVADVDGESEDDDDGATGGSASSSRSSSSSSSSSDTEESTTIEAVEATDESGEAGDEGDGTTETDDSEEPVRVSSASASVRGGSTLEITLPPTDEDDEPADDEGDEPVDEPIDDEREQPTDDGAADDGATDGAAGDGAADTDPNEPPPPPVSQAEIERVEIDVSEDVDAEVEIRQSRSPPSDDASEFQRDDGTQAAGYIQVTDNLDDDQVTEGRLTFRVSKADLETDNTEPGNVALYHYIPETGEWEELDTEVVGETDDFVRFRGTTPGFSQFAAGIKRAQFEISDALVNVQQITLGDSIQVEAIVTNTGGADGTFTTQLLVDSEVVAEDVLTIASGGQRATIFDHEFDQADTYQVRVNDVITGEIQVTDPNAAAESTDDFAPGFGFGTALLTLVVSTLLYRRQAA